MLKEPNCILNKKEGILKWKYNLNMVKFYKLVVISKLQKVYKVQKCIVLAAFKIIHVFYICS